MNPAAGILPIVQRWILDEWPPEGLGEIVEFRLTYDGRLHAASQTDTRAVEKHEIRKKLHPQLRELWNVHPVLKDIGERVIGGTLEANQRKLPIESVGHRYIDVIPDQYERFGYRFMPLISNRRGLACELNILFLRRDEPGGILRSGGDLDNRLKVLFDALRMPTELNQVGNNPPAGDENPFYCLLEDDRRITQFSVITDRLLTQPGVGESQNDVRLIVHVKTIMLYPEIGGNIL